MAADSARLCNYEPADPLQLQMPKLGMSGRNTSPSSGPTAPCRKPRCIECATPFLAMEKGLYIQYEAAWPVTPALPDMA